MVNRNIATDRWMREMLVYVLQVGRLYTSRVHV